MNCEWDDNKAATNLSKHGVAFDEAMTVFDDPDHSIDEYRFIILGQSVKGRLLFVSYMERNNTIRIISAREATLSERKACEQ
jgi:uncharacterized DUF497 family protein